MITAQNTFVQRLDVITIVEMTPIVILMSVAKMVVKNTQAMETIAVLIQKKATAHQVVVQVALSQINMEVALPNVLCQGVQTI